MVDVRLIEEPSGDGESIQYWTEDTRIRMLFRNFSTVRLGGLKAELEVHWNEQPNVKLVKTGWLKFGESISPWARDLAKVAPPSELTEREWHGIIQQASYRAQRWWSMGEPFEHLGENDVEPVRYLMYPLLTSSGATVIAAPGGSGKSFLALSVALTVATGSTRFLGLRPNTAGPVLYLDWEDERATQDERVAALCHAAGAEIPTERLIYSRVRAPLSQAADAISRKIMELPNRPLLVIVDSIGKARGGDVNSSQLTNELFAAIDKLRTPALCIDHKSKEMIENNKAGAIGSIYTWNSARAVWDLEKQQMIGRDAMSVKLSQSKNNRGRLQKPLAWRMAFEMKDAGTQHEQLVGVNYEKIAATNVTPLSPTQQSAAEKVESVLSQSDHALTVRQIADTTELSVQAVRNALQTDKDLFVRVGENTWSIAMYDDQQALPTPF